MGIEALVLEHNKAVLQHFRDLLRGGENAAGLRADNGAGHRAVRVVYVGGKFLRINVDMGEGRRVVDHAFGRAEGGKAAENAEGENADQCKPEQKHPRFGNEAP